jgi:hypothetical protein
MFARRMPILLFATLIVFGCDKSPEPKAQTDAQSPSTSAPPADPGTRPSSGPANVGMYSQLWWLDQARAAATATGDRRSIAQAARDVAVHRCRAGDTDGAIASAAEIADVLLQADAYTSIAKTQAGRGELDGAKRTVEQIKEPDLKVSGYLAISDVQANKGDKENAGRTFAEAKLLWEQIADREAKSFRTGDVVQAQARLGDLPGALATAAQGGGSRDRAIEWVTRGQLRAGDIPGAQTTARAASAAVLRSILAASILESQVASHDIVGANETRESIGDASLRGSAAFRIAQAESEALASRGQVREAMQHADSKIGSGGYWEAAYVAIVIAQAKGDDLNGARSNVEKIDDKYGKRGPAYRAIAEAYARNGDWAALEPWVQGLEPRQRVQACIGAAEGTRVEKRK